jgi:hypothetical protein
MLKIVPTNTEAGIPVKHQPICPQSTEISGLLLEPLHHHSLGSQMANDQAV